MNEFLLILTMLGGNTGIGAVTTHEMANLKQCERVGKAWKADIIMKKGVSTGHGIERFTNYGGGDLIYTCVKLR